MNALLRNVLFLDIETVGIEKDYDQLDERLKTQWARKAAFLKKNDELSDGELFLKKAGIYAEFGKVVAIGIGFFTEDKEGLKFRVKCLSDHDENTLLLSFRSVLEKMDPENTKLCAHNGREFDFPYLSRRMLINGIKLPSTLDLSGKKPWEINHLDTMDMWKFGDWKHYTSLELLASIFNIESSKAQIDGSMVNETYYNHNDLEKIADYCIGDVVVTAQLFCKLKSISTEGLQIVEV